MSAASVAAIVQGDSSPEVLARLEKLLEFLGIPSVRFAEFDDFAWELSSIRGTETSYAVLAPLSCASRLLEPNGEDSENGRFSNASVHSFCLYPVGGLADCSDSLRKLTGLGACQLCPLDDQEIKVRDCSVDAGFSGPMLGIATKAKIREGDCVLAGATAGSNLESILDSDEGPVFFRLKHDTPRTFVTCARAVPDIDEEIDGRWYDVRDRFLSTVPWLLYLKWAFRGVAWESSEAGACLIVDDPILRTRYGHCDFVQLDKQMRQHSFNTSVAMIPWNHARTSRSMAALMKQGGGRLSACIHGCDHTRHEFAQRDPDRLNNKIQRARTRMAKHYARTGILHDTVMVFPQGVFSAESMKALQQQGFVAAVNTEAKPAEPGAKIKVRDLWALAITKYAGFPLFTRRYPSHGVENFAFDLLLGKPCLVVEHHQFFRNNGHDVLRFVESLGAINARLSWRPLGDLLRRCFQSRVRSDGVTQVRMFANELLLTNQTTDECHYEIRKDDAGSAGVCNVTLGEESLTWQTLGSSIIFHCVLPPGGERLVRVSYSPAIQNGLTSRYRVKDLLKIAVRRYLCEIRDNVLSRHTGLFNIAHALMQRRKFFAH